MLEDALYHLFLVNWELFTIAGFMALLLLTGIIIGVQLQFLHVRFRTVPDRAFMMPWRHDEVALRGFTVQSFGFVHFGCWDSA
jgi:hypothetical protein